MIPKNPAEVADFPILAMGACGALSYWRPPTQAAAFIPKYGIAQSDYVDLMQ
jgi:hypothetical protein